VLDFKAAPHLLVVLIRAARGADQGRRLSGRRDLSADRAGREELPEVETAAREQLGQPVDRQAMTVLGEPSIPSTSSPRSLDCVGPGLSSGSPVATYHRIVASSSGRKRTAAVSTRASQRLPTARATPVWTWWERGRRAAAACRSPRRRRSASERDAGDLDHGVGAEHRQAAAVVGDGEGLSRAARSAKAAASSPGAAARRA